MIFYRLKRYELKIIRSFDFILVCSGHDQSLLEKYQPHKKIAVVPNVVDPDFFYPNERMARSNKILFVGTMWYEPNADAIKFFIHQVFPLIKREINDVILLIIGDGAAKEVLKYSRDPAIKIVNYVDDIRPYFEESKVFIAPIRMGSGTRLKILTAMAMGLPVVSTRIGCEGLEVDNGVNIMIADEPLDMKENIVKILRDEGLRQTIAQKGRELVEKKYSLNAFMGQLNKIFGEIKAKK
ncbi:MAG: glycosyltransferase, partial [Thermodesulfobacteriota bacterium]